MGRKLSIRLKYLAGNSTECWSFCRKLFGSTGLGIHVEVSQNGTVFLMFQADNLTYYPI